MINFIYYNYMYIGYFCIIYICIYAKLFICLDIRPDTLIDHGLVIIEQKWNIFIVMLLSKVNSSQLSLLLMTHNHLKNFLISLQIV